MLAELPASVPKLMYSNGLPSDSAHGAGLPSRRVGRGDSRTRNGGGPRCSGSAPSSEAGSPVKPCAARSAKPSSGFSLVSSRIPSMRSATNAMSPISAVPQCGATRACGTPASSATMAAANSADLRTTRSGRHSWIVCRRAGSAARGLRSAKTFFANLTTNSSARKSLPRRGHGLNIVVSRRTKRRMRKSKTFQRWACSIRRGDAYGVAPTWASRAYGRRGRRRPQPFVDENRMRIRLVPT